MTNTTVPNLPAVTSLNGTEELNVVQSNTSARATVAQIGTYVATTYPAPVVSSIATAAPITGGTITSTGTIGLQSGGVTNAYLANMAAGTIKANVTSGSAAPTDATPSAVLDILGTTQGMTLYRGASSWAALPGSGTNTLLSLSGSTSNPAWQTLSYMIDNAIGSASAQGTLLYRDASTWSALAPGTSGQLLRTGGANANPSWFTVTGAGTVTQINTGTGLTGGPITSSGTISIDNTAVSAGAYGSASAVGTFTVNAQGQLTAASNTSIAIAGTAITSGLVGPTYGGTGINNGSNTLTMAGNISHAGAYAQTYTATAATNVTLPAGTTNNYLISSATQLAANPVTGTPSNTTYLRGDGTWATLSSGTVTSVSFTGGLITVATPTTTPALTVAGTSGGIPYFSSASTWASSAALTQYGVVYGGGAGATPVATAAGTTGQVLLATTSAAPAWGQVSLTAGVTGILPPANGGTGVANNAASTLTISGAFGTTLTVTGTTSVTLPTSGILVNTAVTTLSSLSSVGTITSGTWNANVVGPAYGGTGVANNSASTLTISGAFGTTFTVTGTTSVTLPTSGTLATTANTVASFNGGTTGLTPNTNTTGAVTLGGTLGVANGGTGVATLAANNVLLGNGTSSLQVVAPGTNGNVLTSNGTTWVSSTPAVSKAQAVAYAMILGF